MIMFTPSHVIAKQGECNGIRSEAIFSADGIYRYELSRQWSDGGNFLNWIMLNPSTATETENDPTVARCQKRAELLGYDGFRVYNLFAIRATDPKVMLSHSDPVGDQNDAAMKWLVDNPGEHVVFAWGNHGSHLSRSSQVKKMFSGRGNVFYLKLNGSGEPAHPLYLTFNLEFKLWGVS